MTYLIRFRCRLRAHTWSRAGAWRRLMCGSGTRARGGPVVSRAYSCGPRIGRPATCVWAAGGAHLTRTR